MQIQLQLQIQTQIKKQIQIGIKIQRIDCILALPLTNRDTASQFKLNVYIWSVDMKWIYMNKCLWKWRFFLDITVLWNNVFLEQWFSVNKMPLQKKISFTSNLHNIYIVSTHFTFRWYRKFEVSWNSIDHIITPLLPCENQIDQWFCSERS